MSLSAAVVGVLMHEMPTVKASCQFLVGLMNEWIVNFCVCKLPYDVFMSECSTEMTFVLFVNLTI